MCKSPIVVNKYKQSYDVYIGRGSYWGNPYTHIKDKTTKASFIVETREESIIRYKDHLRFLCQEDKRKFLHELASLEGKILGCFCKPKPCHGDVILEVFNELKAKDII